VKSSAKVARGLHPNIKHIWHQKEFFDFFVILNSKFLDFKIQMDFKILSGLQKE